ncbi:MAG TPA: DUF2341 domain-containing protein [Chitinophagales bacterium]|nr:DUF2341 domain-containing protein [Chitinophagales bacterium]
MKKHYLLTLMAFFAITNLHAQLFGWNYFTPITIVENTGSPLYNYQVKLKINTQQYIQFNQMAVSGNDIRFGNNEYGDKLYPYWIESGINTDSTTIWVRIDTMLGYECKTIYMYYGKNNAVAGSSIDSTFIGPFSATDSLTTTTNSSSNSGTNIGYAFVTNDNLLVTALGKHSNSLTVTLFGDYWNQSVIRQANVSGNANGNFYTALVSPVWLNKGRTYVITVYSPNGNPKFSSTHTLNSHLTWSDSRKNDPALSANEWPNSPLATGLYGIPDFHFYVRNTALVEPSYFMGENTLHLAPEATVYACSGQTVQLGSNATGAIGNVSYIWSPATGLSNSHIAEPTTTATTSRNYILTALDAGTGCTTSAAISLTVKQPSTLIIIDSICAGETYYIGTTAYTTTGQYTDTLSAAATNGCDSIVKLTLTINTILQPTIAQTGNVLQTGTYNTYQWYLNNSPVADSTNSSITVTEPGNYSVVVTNNNQCSDTSQVFAVTSVRINETDNTYTALVSPVPFNNNIKISCDWAQRVEIYNSIGQQVYFTNNINTTTNIDTYKWPTGLYVINMYGNGKHIARNVLKTK